MIVAQRKRKPARKPAQKPAPITWDAATIRAFRDWLTAKRGWNQAACAEHFGVTARQWRNWENGSRSPSVAMLRWLTDAAAETQFTG